MNAQQFFELLARLPARVWLQGILGLIGFVVLAVLGFAVIAGFAAVVLVILLLYRLRAWVGRLCLAMPMPFPSPDWPGGGLTS